MDKLQALRQYLLSNPDIDPDSGKFTGRTKSSTRGMSTVIFLQYSFSYRDKTLPCPDRYAYIPEDRLLGIIDAGQNA